MQPCVCLCVCMPPVCVWLCPLLYSGTAGSFFFFALSTATGCLQLCMLLPVNKLHTGCKAQHVS